MIDETNLREIEARDQKAGIFRPRILFRRVIGPWGMVEITHGPILIAITLVVVFYAIGRDIEIGLMIAAAMFLAVVIHEFGHAITARLMGKAVLQIRLSALSGHCTATDVTTRRERLLFSAGGVLANTLAAVLILLVAALCLLLDPVLQKEPRVALQSPLYRWFIIGFCFNLVMVVMNALPSWGSDGMSLLHATLSGRLPEPMLLRICGGLALITGAVGLLATVVLFRLGYYVPVLMPIGNAWQVLRTGNIPILPQPSPA